jgi:hypothetical protein
VVNSGKTGRPERPGERYPSGGRKDPDDQRASAIWRRLVEDGELLGADPRLSSQIGRLRLHRELTDSQASAADLIGRIMGRYERLHGKRRSTRSPSYEFSTGGARDRNEDPEWVEQVEADYRRLQECIPVFPREARDIIEQLCCEDRHIMAIYLNDVRAVLDRVVAEFELGPAPLVLEVKSVTLPPLRRPRFRKPRAVDEGLAATLARTATPAAAKPVRKTRAERFEQGEFSHCPAAAVPSATTTEPKAIADRDRTEREIAAGNSRRALEQGGEAPA